MAVTLVRVPLLGVLLWSIAADVALVVPLVLVFVTVDVLDGVVARRLDGDTRERRTCDALLDRVSIHAAFGVAIATHPTFVLLYVPVACRDLLSIVASGWLLVTKDVLLVGGRWHKLASVSCATFGVALVEGRGAVVAGVVAVVLNYVLLIDYAGGYMMWRATPSPRAGRYSVERLTGIRYVGARMLRRFLVHQPSARSVPPVVA